MTRRTTAATRAPRSGKDVAAVASGARAVVFMEADGTDDPAQVRHLVGPILADTADLVVGSRREAVHGAAAGRMPLHQRLGNDWLAFNLFVFFGLRLSDDGPFRAVRLDLLERLRLEVRAYAFPTEMVVKARLVGAPSPPSPWERRRRAPRGAGAPEGRGGRRGTARRRSGAARRRRRD